MWDYPSTVEDHVFNPRNAGVLAEANAVGEAGSPSCGDALRLMLKIDPGAGLIEDARFQATGCGPAIAASSALTELLIGQTIEQAEAISPQDVVAILGGLPPEKRSCAEIGRKALRAALMAYRGEAGQGEAAARGRLVCRCFSLRLGTLASRIRAQKLTSLEQVRAQTDAGSNCSACREALEQVLAATNAKMVEEGRLAPADAFHFGSFGTRVQRATTPFVHPGLARRSAPQPSAPRPARPADANPGTASVREAILIARLLEDARPSFKADGGDVELVDYADATVFVSLSGVCAGCSAASLTLGGLRQKIVQTLGRPVRVVPVPCR